MQALWQTIGEIDIGDCVLVASGRVRNVYEHRDLPGVLIKTLRTDLDDLPGLHGVVRHLKKLRPVGAYFVFQREMTEFLIQCGRRLGRDQALMPISRLYGLVRTSDGMGLVVEKVTALGGGLAPTLRNLVAVRGFGERQREALERFFRECTERHVVLGDVNPGNIVYTESRDPRGEFVCIDGFGEKAALPVHRWIKFVNSRKIARVRRRMLDFIAKGKADPIPGTREPASFGAG